VPLTLAGSENPRAVGPSCCGQVIESKSAGREVTFVRRGEKRAEAGHGEGRETDVEVSGGPPVLAMRHGNDAWGGA